MLGRIEHLVKFNPVANRLFTLFASAGVSLLGAGNSVQENLILFTSDIGKSYTGSPRAIYEYMRDSGALDGFEAVWAFTKPEEHQDMECRVVKHDSVDYFRVALKAKYWVTDVNIERGLRFKRKDTVYLNTWHGSTFKTLGHDIHDRIYYDCSSIDFMCASSEYDARTFSSAFDMPAHKFVFTGLPRNDQLHANANSDSGVFKERVGLPKDKKVILYAPTWRDTADGGSSYTIAPPIDVDRWKNELGQECVLAFRMHPLTQAALGLEEDDFLLDYSRYQPLNDLLLASDCLITDYSSIAFDYAILKRPVLCFGYDVESYEKARGLYLDVETIFPKGNSATEDELLGTISEIGGWGSEEYSAPLYTQFNEFGGNASKECVDLLFPGTGKFRGGA